jgi:hypothetical protein
VVLGSIAAILVATTGSLLALVQSQRARAGILAMQYAGAAGLAWEWADGRTVLARLAAGLAACAIVWVGVADRPQGGEPHRISRLVRHPLHGVAVGVVLIAAVGLGSGGGTGMPGIGGVAAAGATVLMALGLLQMGTGEDAFRMATGILTLLAGFELIYGRIEPSLAVVALLGAVHIGVALVCAYMMRLRGMPNVGEGTVE